MSAVISPAAPFMGLKPFAEKDAIFFFGREEMSEIVSVNLMSSRLTIIYGPSGVGKSSLLHAGVVNHLKQTARTNRSRNGDPGIAIAIVDKWKGDPLQSLLAEARRALIGEQDDEDFTPSSASIVESIREMTEDAGRDLLIIFDQFEEYFLYHANETGEGTFATEFPRLATSPDLRFNALIAIRDDAYTKLYLFKDDLFNLSGYSIAINRLNRDEAREAIIKPIDQYNRLFAALRQPAEIEPELVEAVLDQVNAERNLWNKNEREETSKKGIEATYLQLVMDRLWREETASGSTRLRLETFERLGGAEGIVSDHLLSVLKKLNEDESKVAERLFYHLVTSSRTKIAYPVYALVDRGVDRDTLRSVLTAFSENRILRPVPSPSGETAELYEIFHDQLAEPILEWSHEREVEAQRLVAEEEKRKAEEQKRIARRMSLLAITAATLLVLNIILLVWAYVEKNENQRLKNQYDKELKLGITVDYFNKDTFSILYDKLYRGDKLSEVKEAIETSLQGGPKEGDEIRAGILLHHLGWIFYRESQNTRLDKTKRESLYKLSEQRYREGIETFRRVLSEDHPYLANVLNDLGALYYMQADFSNAEPYFRKALEIRRRAIGLRKQYLIADIHNLAAVYVALGEYGKAEGLYKEELEAYNEDSRLESLDGAKVMRLLGNVYFEQGKYDGAVTRLAEALRIAKNNFPSDSPELLSYLSSLSRVYRGQNKNAEAESLYRQALGINIGGADTPNTAYHNWYMGMLYSDQGKYDEAESLLNEALSVFDQSDGSRYFNGIFVRIKLAEVYEEQNKFDKAEPLYIKALDIQKRYLGDNRRVADTLERYAALLQKLNQKDKAAQLLSEAERIRSKQPNSTQK